LIIDPVIVYSTFLGGSGSDRGTGIAVDGTGNAYVTGATTSTTFPGVTTGSIQRTNGGGGGDGDAFVTKINAAGTAIIYSTFLGGSGSDQGLGIAVDVPGNAYVTGETSSSTFPGVSVTAGSIQPNPGGGGFSDAFVTKINPAGNKIVYSTFLGGSGSDVGFGIAVDGNTGNAYVTGFTESTTFPVTPGSIQLANGGGGGDAFVTMINAAGTKIVYSTFLGGNGFDGGLGIAVDGTGNAYVTGFTGSTTFPVTPGSIQLANGGGTDAFVTKINAAGTKIVYSTFLGGSGSDRGTGIAVDGTGNAYVTGQTSSTTFPGVTAGSIQPANGGGNDAFVTKINAAGNAIVYSTFLGGSGSDGGNGIAVDGTGNAYVTGATTSTTFPGVTTGSIQPVNGGGGGDGDAFVTKIGGCTSGFVSGCCLGPVPCPGATTASDFYSFLATVTLAGTASCTETVTSATAGVVVESSGPSTLAAGLNLVTGTFSAPQTSSPFSLTISCSGASGVLCSTTLTAPLPACQPVPPGKTGTLSISKVVDVKPGQSIPPTAFSISVNCGGNVNLLSLNSGQLQTLTQPAGTSCTVSEILPPSFSTAACPKSLATWLPPTFFPSATVVISSSLAKLLVVHNTFTCN
ncbi:MAG TPA: SBBP repeat-containing protein, partial [Thermoanaerobaculia bacterium]|nr:SBBP repeat-containing protein [Thermoanaerobaculia bacterium]